MGLLDKMLGRDDDRRDGPTTRAANAPNATVDFSDVQGTSSSQTVERERHYTVVAGDSLSKIAQREYGDATQWQRIYEANRDTVKNPNLIHPGQVLTLPVDV